MHFVHDVAVVLDDFAPCSWEALAMLQQAKCLAPRVCAVALGHERPMGILYPFSWDDKAAMLDAVWCSLAQEAIEDDVLGSDMRHNQKTSGRVFQKAPLVDVAADALLTAKRFLALMHSMLHGFEDSSVQAGGTLNAICLCSRHNRWMVQAWIDSLNTWIADSPQWPSMVFTLADMTDAAVGPSPRDLREMALGLVVAPLNTPWPKPVNDYLKHHWQHHNALQLKHECNAIMTHRAMWHVAPYPPVLVTVDAMVFCHGFVLLVQRGRAPGYGQWAWPGGFVEPQEFLLQGCLRELAEETQLDVAKHLLESSLKCSKTFDNPARSARGRVITHVFVFDVSGFIPVAEKANGIHDQVTDSDCPTVAAADDAMAVRWVAVQTFLQMRAQMHDDHHDMGMLMMKEMGWLEHYV